MCNEVTKLLSKSSPVIYDAKRALTIKWVADKHCVSKEYVRMIINHNENISSIRAKDIEADFISKYTELNRLLS